MITAPHSTARLWRNLAAGAGLFAVALAGSVGAFAQNIPDAGGLDRDPVSGYFCVDPGCGFVRITEASCICQKMNPGERRLDRLQLKCSAKEGGEWVACPVAPRYGISVQ